MFSAIYIYDLIKVMQVVRLWGWRIL